MPQFYRVYAPTLALATFLTCGLTPRLTDGQGPADAATTSEQKNRSVLVARVLDDKTGEPIEKFIALAGTSPMEGLGWQWQGHTAHEFKDGKLDWPPPKLAGYKEQVVRIEADDYIPYQTPQIKHLVNGEVHDIAGAIADSQGSVVPRIITAQPGQPASLEIRLRQDPGVPGRVLLSTGEPAADADVAIGMANDQIVRLNDGKISFSKRLQGRIWPSKYRQTKTDKDGRFTLPTEIQTAAVVIAHPLGVKIQSYEEFEQAPEVTLQPWGRIEGQVLWGDSPGSGERVSLIAHGAKGSKSFQPIFMIAIFQDAVADQSGNFVFEFVPPGPAQISCKRPAQHVDVISGATTRIVFGGKGRPVVGKLVGRDSWDDVRIRIAPNAPRPGDMGTEHDPWPAYQTFLSSPAGKNYLKGDISIKPDGSFRIEDVPPEYYQLFVSVKADSGKSQIIGGTKLTVKTIQDGQSNEPLDIGEVKVSPDEETKRDAAKATGATR